MPARIELITTGSELLLGHTTNTHVDYIARQLFEIGLRLDRQVTVADHRVEMRNAIADVSAIRNALGWKPQRIPVAFADVVEFWKSAPPHA